MLTLIERGFSEKLIICGDFNLPGLNSISIDDRLSTLLDTHGYQQHVSEPTRCNNMLDLLISPISLEMQTLVSNVTVVSSNDLSDHNLVIGDQSIRRIKQAPTSSVYRNVKNINIADFEQRIRSSPLFTDPVDTPDEYLSQFESTITSILDVVAPVRRGTRPGGRKAAKWLEPEAVSAKQNRRRLERRWKRSGCEQDRVAYRVSCRRANDQGVKEQTSLSTHHRGWPGHSPCMVCSQRPAAHRPPGHLNNAH